MKNGIENKKTLVLTYGTLMNGRRNHFLIEDAECLGPATLQGYQMFELGRYPGIAAGEGTVFGELYAVYKDQLQRLDDLESNGRLYQRTDVTVRLTKTGELLSAQVYVYLRNLKGCERVWEYMQPWGCDLEETVWYVAYGSNLNRERFMQYIVGGRYKGCSRVRPGCGDKTPPQDDEPWVIDRERYFGQHSGNWDNSGVAFLDKDRFNNTLGRGWLIKRSQLRDVHKQEGQGSEWYDTVICLSGRDGHPAYTFTNHRRLAENKPAEEYLKVIRAGEQEIQG